MGRSIVRLKDIADKTGFSTNTVSLALRESPRIPQQTRDIIREAANQLNYLPNQIAKSLVSRETKTIGLVITDITNPTLTQTAQALELDLAARGYRMLFATSNNIQAEEKSVIEMFRSRQVDGILVYPTSNKNLEHIHALRLFDYPIVSLVNDPNSGIDAVGVDDMAGAQKATEHLIELGHRRIAILDSARPTGNTEKLQGYQTALAEAQIPIDETLHLVPNGPTSADGFAAMAQIMAQKHRPTAVFTTTDTLAIGALSWCQKNNLAVPNDIAVIGFDNIDFAEFAATPLSTINYDAQKVSDLAVEKLMQLIQVDGHLPPPQNTLIDPALVVRESTKPTNQ